MGNRKLPFGYQMRMGEIVRNEPEAKAVQDIFLQYTLGASLKEIAEQMSKTDIKTPRLIQFNYSSADFAA